MLEAKFLARMKKEFPQLRTLSHNPVQRPNGKPDLNKERYAGKRSRQLYKLNPSFKYADKISFRRFKRALKKRIKMQKIEDETVFGNPTKPKRKPRPNRRF